MQPLLTLRAARSLLTLFVTISISSALGAQATNHAEFESCYARWTESELTIGNAHFVRKWRIANGLLTATSFRDLDQNVEWILRSANRPAPFAPGINEKQVRKTSISARPGRLNVVEEGSLLVDVSAGDAPSAFRCQFQVFPAAHGVAITSSGGSAVAVEKSSNRATDAPTGVESSSSVAAANDAGDSTEDLLLAPQHLRFTQVELLDQTDSHNELVFEREWLLGPNEGALKLAGNLFFVEDTLTGAGLIFLKLAPLPHARPVKSDFDALVTPAARRFRFVGQHYASVLLAYHGGRFGRMEALQTFQRQLRAYDPSRDGKFLSNTWGDRSRDARINEPFMLKEIEAGARLGVDVVQIDDGWQKGRTANSAAGKGAWNGYWAADPNFWQPHPERLPGGLAPLVSAAKTRGMKFGLWFGPDTSNEGASWQRDADRLIELHQKEGIDYFKLDSVKAVTLRTEENFHRFLGSVIERSAGRVVFDLDVTAEIRPGYFGAPHAGPIFVENRYTDWHRYWPHQTLRSLWKLSQYVDPLRLRVEFLNNARQTNQYPNDPLAPANYQPDCLFASVMFANPLGWFEASNLPEDYVRSVSSLTAVWKRERERLFSGRTFPIGAAPDGVSWTGFASVAVDRKSGYVLLFRELSDKPECSLELPLFGSDAMKVTVLAGNGSATVANGKVQAAINAPLGYIWARVEAR